MKRLPFSLAMLSCVAATAAPLHSGTATARSEGSCEGCHTPDVRAGRIDIDFGRIASYQPGEGQEIRIKVVAKKARSRFGIHITAEDLQGRQAGVFSLVDESVAIHVMGEGKQHVQHQQADGSEFRFRWTAPVNDVGAIRFQAVGVALGAGAGTGESVSATFDLRAAGTTVIPSGYKWDFIDTMSDAVGISNDGRIVGAGLLRNGDGSMVTIQVPGSASLTVADVNSAGIVVGSFKDSASATHGFARSAGGAIATVDFPGATNSELVAINDQGQALGRMQLDNVRRNFLRAPDGTLQLIDNSVFTGELLDLTNDGRFLGLRGQPIPFPGLAQALYILRLGEAGTNVDTCTGSRGGSGRFAINDNADLLMNCTEIGPGFFPSQNDRIHFSNGDSESFPPSADGVYLVTPKAINASGQIAGVGTISGDGRPSRAIILTPCEVSVSSAPIHIPFDGGTATVRVRGPAGCRARVGRPNYVPYSPPGPGDGLIVITSGPNFNATQLTDSITIGNTTIAITVDGRPPGSNCTYSISPDRLRFAASGGSMSLIVTTPEGCPWTLTGIPSWITTTDSLSGTGYKSFYLTVTANTSGARNATLGIAGHTFVFQQLGSGDCTVLPALGNVEVRVFGSIDIAANPGCSWSASSDSPWLRLSLSGSSTEALTVNGAGPTTIFLPADANPQAFSRTANLTVNGQTVVVTQFGKAGKGYYFVPSSPCRIADTRPEGNKWTGFGPPSISLGGTRAFALAAAGCGIPSGATAVSANITVVPKGYLGFLTAWQAGQGQPVASTLNSWNGRVVANAALLPVKEGGASISIYVSNETDVIIDVNGYFVPSEFNSGLQFFPLNPCRVADTRSDGGKTGEFGPPSIPVGGGTRSFRVPQSGCGVPSNAQAYSLNVTAVPPGYLAYLTAWPTGQDQPLVSTLNSWDGQVVPNAAIVPAGTNGAISVSSPNATDVVIDVNGYFAPPAPGGMNYYPVTPCRVADTRSSEGKAGAFGPPSIQAQTLRTIPIPASGCGIPSTAQAFALNLTAVPQGYLGFVTAWPAGSTQPLASTLNSWNGQVVANAALVPAGTNGSVSFFVSNTTDLVVDVNGFFQP